jgi:uncharacterized protein
MTFAWYAHLKQLNDKPWIVAALISWGIAFFEYVLQVPGNRIGYTVFFCRSAKDAPGSHYPVGLRAFRAFILKGAIKARLLVGRLMCSGRRLLHISKQVGRCLNARARPKGKFTMTVMDKIVEEGL